MNSLNDDELNKIQKLKQKLYSHSLNDNPSKLNQLHKHNIDIPISWDKKVEYKEDESKKNTIQDIKKESVSDFLDKKFGDIQGDSLSAERSIRIENKIDKTKATLKIAEAQLLSKKNQLYPNLKKADEIKSDFTPDYNPDTNKIIIGENADIQSVKNPENFKKNKKTTFSFLFFISMFIFFIGAAIYAYINISHGVNTISTNKIDIKITGPVSVKSGEVTDFIVDITNNNTTDLILSDLVIQYPDGSKSPSDINNDLNNERISVGTVKPGETVRRKNSIVFFGEQNSNKNIKYSYEFNINESATVFRTEKDVGVSIEGSPISVNITNVKEINNDQELFFDIELNSNTEELLKNIQLKVEYPFGYKLLSSNPKPVSDNNTWSFESVDSLSSTSIRLKGKFAGEVNVDKNFRFILGVEDVKTKEMLTVLSTQDVQVAIRKPFVITKLLIDGDDSDNKSVNYDQNFRSDLIITNSLKDNITDVIVEVLIDGVLIDRRGINSSDGFYDSSQDIIFWDKSLNKGLVNIPPGESRELGFNLRIIKSDENLIKNLRRSVSNLTINIKAKRLGENRVSESIVASTKKQLRLKTDVLLNSNISYVDGVFSPEVNKETIYKYVGNISNTANTLRNVVFTANLPPNANWQGIYNTGILASATTYNKSTREISIKIGDIEAGAGITEKAKEVSFKIGFTPSLTQVGKTPIIIINPIITATDSFTGENIQIKNSSLTTDVTLGDKSEVDPRVK